MMMMMTLQSSTFKLIVYWLWRDQPLYLCIYLEDKSMFLGRSVSMSNSSSLIVQINSSLVILNAKRHIRSTDERKTYSQVNERKFLDITYSPVMEPEATFRR